MKLCIDNYEFILTELENLQTSALQISDDLEEKVSAFDTRKYYLKHSLHRQKVMSPYSQRKSCLEFHSTDRFLFRQESKNRSRIAFSTEKPTLLTKFNENP